MAARGAARVRRREREVEMTEERPTCEDEFPRLNAIRLVITRRAAGLVIPESFAKAIVQSNGLGSGGVKVVDRNGSVGLCDFAVAVLVVERDEVLV